MVVPTDIFSTLTLNETNNQTAKTSSDGFKININSEVNLKSSISNESVMEKMWNELCQIPDQSVILKPLLGCSFQELTSQGKAIRKVILRITRKKIIVFEILDKLQKNGLRMVQVIFLHAVPYELMIFKIQSERRHTFKIMFSSGQSFYYKMLRHPSRSYMWCYWKKFLTRCCKLRRPDRILPISNSLPTIIEEEEDDTFPSNYKNISEESLSSKLLSHGSSYAFFTKVKTSLRAFREDLISQKNGEKSLKLWHARHQPHFLRLPGFIINKTSRQTSVRQSQFYKRFFIDKYVSLST